MLDVFHSSERCIYTVKRQYVEKSIITLAGVRLCACRVRIEGGQGIREQPAVAVSCPPTPLRWHDYEKLKLTKAYRPSHSFVLNVMDVFFLTPSPTLSLDAYTSTLVRKYACIFPSHRYPRSYQSGLSLCYYALYTECKYKIGLV